MAKPTTNNKKPHQKKQNKSFFGKKFDIKSRKVQFFVSILVIAILGGGYFTFKSFAAVNDFVYTPSNGWLRSYDSENRYVTEKNGKNNQLVLQLPPYYSGKIANREGATPQIPRYQYYKYCVMVAKKNLFNGQPEYLSSDEAKNISISLNSDSESMGQFSTDVPYQKYIEYCTRPIMRKYESPIRETIIRNNTGFTISISSARLRFVEY